MAGMGQRSISIRVFKGVDLTDNARITNPGAWQKLTNLWAPQPGKIEQRPGGVVFAKKVVDGPAPINKSNWELPPDTFELPHDISHYDPEIVVSGKYTTARTRIQINSISVKAAGAKRYTGAAFRSALYDANF